jgi:phage-related protein
MPLCRPLGNALYEVRSSLPSRREARLIFFQDGEALVIVGGFFKKTRTTSQSELNSARLHQANYRKNKANLNR